MSSVNVFQLNNRAVINALLAPLIQLENANGL